MKNAIEHRGYLGEVEVDFEGGCMYASIANADGLYLTAEGTTPAELETAFKSIIDDYLAGAQADGWVVIEPKMMATT